MENTICVDGVLYYYKSTRQAYKELQIKILSNFRFCVVIFNVSFNYSKSIVHIFMILFLKKEVTYKLYFISPV